MTVTAPVGGIWAMKNGDDQPSNFADTDSGLAAALAYASTNGRVQTGGSLTISSTQTIPDGCDLYLAPGGYTMTGSAYFSVGNGSTIRGAGFNSTQITLASTYAGTSVITNTNQVGGAQSCMVRDLTVNGNRAAGATATQLIYIKGLGQPTMIENVVVFGGSGVGIKLEGISSNAASMVYVNNCWTNDFLGHGTWVTGPMGGVTIWRHSAETIPANKAGIYIDGASSATDQGGIWIRDFHCEVLAANAIGILLEDSKDITVDNALYFGSGGLGDLVKITGTPLTNSYNITLRNLYVRFNATATTVNDVSNGVTLTNEVHYYSTGDHRLINNAVIGGTLDLTGKLTARASSADFGTAGVAHTHNVGLGGTGAFATDLVVNSGSSGATLSRMQIQRNSVADLLLQGNGTTEQMQFRHQMIFATTGGAGLGTVTTGGLWRFGDSNTPSNFIEPAAGTTSAAPIKLTSGTNRTSPVPGAIEFTTDDLYFTITTGTVRAGVMLNNGTNLTSGKYPKVTTNGRLTDGPTPLSGTKVYYVSDTSGGAVTRKLTFTDGILTAET